MNKNDKYLLKIGIKKNMKYVERSENMMNIFKKFSIYEKENHPNKNDTLNQFVISWILLDNNIENIENKDALQRSFAAIDNFKNILLKGKMDILGTNIKLPFSLIKSSDEKMPNDVEELVGIIEDYLKENKKIWLTKNILLILSEEGVLETLYSPEIIKRQFLNV